MAATIQTIQKPKKARALDTSTSEQETYDIQTDGTFTATDETNWTTGTGVSISGNYMVFEDVGGNTGNAVQGYNGTALRGAGARGISSGDRYRVQATISDPASGSFDGQVRIVLYAAGRDGSAGGGKHYAATSYATSAGTIDEIITIDNTNTGGYNDAIVINGADDPGDFRVSNLKVTKLESFGNNNHGQIYSGRALEFDGVSDYLEIGETTFLDFSEQSTTSEKAWTVAAWINFDAVGTLRQNIIGSNNSTASGTIAISSNEKLYIYDHGSSVGREGNTILHPETWYRAAWVFNGIDTVTFYLNGVADGTGAIGAFSNNYDLKFRYIGVWDASDATPRIFKGKMSDLQLWQRAWTADDVLYDYNNPEQLALNRGGTLLTNSNLKAWYPMNDGHRGQQSYILDASNTGLGDELLNNADFSSYTEHTGTIGNSNISGLEFDDWGEQGGSNGSTGSGAYTISTIPNGFRAETTIAPSNGWVHRVYQDLSSTLVIGKTYKLTFEIKANRTGTFVASIMEGDSSNKQTPDSSISALDTFESSTHYFTCTSVASNTGLYFWLNNPVPGEYYEVRNVSLKTVNDKNHATTVFYGDELLLAKNSGFESAITMADSDGAWLDEDQDSSLDCQVVRNAGSEARTGNDCLKITLDGSTIGNALLRKDNLTIGRQYIFQGWAKADSSNGATAATLGVGTTANSTTTKTATTLVFSSANTYYEFTGSSSLTFTATATTMYLHIMPFGSSTDITFVDDLSLKEVGVASGWTDADQQLDIPQTALQSYNQLAWFDGVADEVQITDHSDFSFEADVPFSISAWIYMNDSVSYPIVCKDSGSHREWALETKTDGKLYFTLWDNSANARQARLYNTALTSYEGKWIHVVGTYNGNESDADAGIKIYINGERVDDTNDSSGSYTAMEDKGGVVSIGATLSQSKFANGCTTEVSIWDTSLSQTYVNELYNDGKAIDCLQHSLYVSQPAELFGYWRNNGLATWANLDNPGTHDGSPTSLTETMLITAGADGSRDSQGFIMNRQRATNSLNLDYKVLPDGQYGEVKGFNFHATTFSIAFWIKTPTVTANATIIDKYEDSGNLRALRVYITSSQEIQLQLSSTGSNNESQKTTDANLANDTWYHIALTYSSGTFAAYKNGDALSVDGNFSTVTSVEQNTAPLYIGRAQDGAKLPFEGEIDDLVVYEDVLTAAEVKRNYNAGKRSHR